MKMYPEFTKSIKLLRQFYAWTELHVDKTDVRWTGWLDQTWRALVSFICGLGEGHGRVRINQKMQYVLIGRASLWEGFALLLASPWPVPDDILNLAQEVMTDVDKTLASIAEKRLSQDVDYRQR